MNEVKYGKKLINVVHLTQSSVSISPDSEVDLFTNLGATGTVNVTLPPAKKGMTFQFSVLAAQRFEIDPNGSEVISLVGADQTAGVYIYNATVGGYLNLVCHQDGKWKDVSRTGTWITGA